MLTRKTAFTIALLTLALTLLALACAPAAPLAQDNAPPATAEPAPTATPTPTPATRAANDLALLDGFLRARVAEYEAAQSGTQGPSGPAAAPKIVSINISARSSESRQNLLTLLANRGATNTSIFGSTQIYADIPASLLSTLAARADINDMQATAFPYPNLDADLNGLAVRYEAGLIPSEDTEPTYAMMSIFIEGGDNYDAVKEFLVTGGAIMTFGDTIIEDTYKPLGMLVAFVPVKLFAELDGQPGIYDSGHEIYPVPEWMRRTEYAPEKKSESKRCRTGRNWQRCCIADGRHLTGSMQVTASRPKGRGLTELCIGIRGIPGKGLRQAIAPLIVPASASTTRTRARSCADYADLQNRVHDCPADPGPDAAGVGMRAGRAAGADGNAYAYAPAGNGPSRRLGVCSSGGVSAG